MTLLNRDIKLRQIKHIPLNIGQDRDGLHGTWEFHQNRKVMFIYNIQLHITFWFAMNYHIYIIRFLGSNHIQAQSNTYQFRSRHFLSIITRASKSSYCVNLDPFHQYHHNYNFYLFYILCLLSVITNFCQVHFFTISILYGAQHVLC